jgi:diguanylate cyclase (GGDEF)-like protein
MEDVIEAVKWNGLDLSAAVRILEHAGRCDPTQLDLEPLTQLQALIDGLCDLSMHDGLTGLMNATFFQALLVSELDRSGRTGRNCALMLLDLDRFKLVNDNHGHLTGDLVLRAVAIQLKRSLRNMDTAARIGGEEFAVFLPECSPEGAVRAATRIHAGINPLMVPTGSLTLRVTASAGLVWTDPGRAAEPRELLARADAELYRAKRLGRERLLHPDLLPTQMLATERASLVLARPEEDSYEQ